MKIDKLIKHLKAIEATHPDADVYLETPNNPVVFINIKAGDPRIYLEGSYGRDLSDEIKERYKFYKSGESDFKSDAEFVGDLLDRGFPFDDVVTVLDEILKKEEN